jgi:TetR/AcrR family fatty acid metabolism transcriptional regulator
MDSKRKDHPPLHSRRQRRIERRRQEIIAAAAQIFAEKGYANTTTKELAEAADMAEGTLYNYFEGKRGILLAILNEMSRPIDALLQDARVLQSREDFVDMVDKSLAIFMSHLNFTHTLLTEIWVDDVILEDFVVGRLQHIGQSVQAFIVKGIEAGRFRAMDPEITTVMILGTFLALIIPVLRGKSPTLTPQERHKVAETAVDLLLDGIRVRAV